MQSLSTVLTTDFGVDLSGWTLNFASGISDDDNVIVGYGTNPSGQTEAWLAVIPEPSSLSLLLWSLLGIAASYRRRRRAA